MTTPTALALADAYRDHLALAAEDLAHGPVDVAEARASLASVRLAERMVDPAVRDAIYHAVRAERAA